MDRYLRGLLYEAKRIISHQKLTTATELVEAVEQYQAASDMLRPTRNDPVASLPARPRVPRQSGLTLANPPSNPPFRGSSQPVPHRLVQNPEVRQCYHCGKLGHISWQCERLDVPMPTAESASGPQVPFAALLGQSRDRRPTCPVKVNQRDVEALLDSGSARTLIQEAVLEASFPAQGNLVPVVCVH
ncbi:hypothetical protein VZT92_011714 [Zoarces viviparus]|uniref:CCHC-type domain-containing protein n=1 Tax=Zoarces viviparus TaxID=48416 RepID=A0AAW1F636_ZOAVI